MVLRGPEAEPGKVIWEMSTKERAMASNRPSEYVACPRCNTPLQYGGTKQFHEGTRFWDFMGGVFELLKGREAFDLYVCPRCGRVELFVDGIGEAMRGEEE
jgi:uncharacterized protein YbaR (Trm112 family)